MAEIGWRITEVWVIGPDGVRRKPQGKVWRRYLRRFQARHGRRGGVYGAPQAERVRQRRQQYHQRRRNRVKRA